ncbi:lasso peptide biosynthesis PqqD family chaperone [bacterium]|nr:lasso peptide biosynthesis PqqD family chaperone [bacterium]
MDEKQLTATSVIARNRELVSSDIDGEVVMMSIENGKYYGLDLIGSRIWELIEKPLPVSDLIDQLLLEFKVERETCEKDVIYFLQKLDDDNMLEIK